MSNRLRLLRERAVRPRRTVPIQLDGVVREQIEAVEEELDRLDRSPQANDRRLSSKSADARRKELESELERLYAAAEETTLYVVMEALQRTTYRALCDAHPPRNGSDGKPLPEDHQGVNAETFPPALVKASIVGYKETPDAADTDVKPFPEEGGDDGITVDWLMEWMTDYQVAKLAAVCVTLNRGDDLVPTRRRRSGTASSAVE